MSYLHSILLAKPSLHLQALRISGLDLEQVFESVPLTCDTSRPATAEAEELLHQPTPALPAGQALGKLQFNELCLNDE